MVKRDYITAHNGLRTVVWEQQLDGIAVFEAVLISHTTGRGELVSLSSQFVQDASSAADKGHRNKARKRDEPRLSAAEAVLKAAQNVGEPLQPTDVQAQTPVLQSAPNASRLRWCWPTTSACARSMHATAGKTSQSEYDDLGRLVKKIDNYVDGTPGPGTDEDRTTIYEYNRELVRVPVDVG